MNTTWIEETKAQIFPPRESELCGEIAGETRVLDKETLFCDRKEWLLVYVESGNGTFHFADQYQGAKPGVLLMRSFTDSLCYRPHGYAGSMARVYELHLPVEKVTGFLAGPTRNSMQRQAPPDESFVLIFQEEEQAVMGQLFREACEGESFGIREAAAEEILARIDVEMKTGRKNMMQEGLAAESETLGFDVQEALFGKRWNPGLRTLLLIGRRIKKWFLRVTHP